MERTHSDVNVVLPGFLSGGDEEALALISAELEPLGLTVGDVGLRTELSSAEPPLRFVLDLVHNPFVTGAIVAKTYDVVLGETVKAVLGELVGAGKNGVTALYRALSERFPGRQIQIEIETPDGVNYPVGPEMAAKAVPKIAYDFAKERSGRRGSDRIYFNGEWMTTDEYFAAFRAERRAERTKE
jgi:hypothetical protein